MRVPYGSKRTAPHLLRRALLEISRDYGCALCQNPGEWLGSTLRLQVDHIDGDYHDNLPTNLRLLCPNCHTQADNFSGRSRGRYTRPTELPTHPSLD